MDDVLTDPDAVEQFNHFSQRFLRGLSHPDEICAVLAKVIKDIEEFFGSENPRLGSFGTMSCLSGIDAFCQEARFTKELPGQIVGHRYSKGRVQWSAQRPPNYLRLATGVPDCYAMPIFNPSHNVSVQMDIWYAGIPDLFDYVNHINDLLSFPKEALELENFNYLSLTTRKKRQAGQVSHFDSNDTLWTFRDTLFETFDEVLTHAANVDGLLVNFADALVQELEDFETQAEVDGLTGEEASVQLKKKKEEVADACLAAKLWTKSKHGYISWHILSPRYGLESLRATHCAPPNNKQNGTGV